MQKVTKLCAKLLLIVDLERNLVIEGADFAWKCTADAQPDDVQYTWYKDDKKLGGELALRATISVRFYEFNFIP